jgi:hypothetical protein
MGRRRSYNPNTKAGRRNIRQQYYENYEKRHPKKNRNMTLLCFLGGLYYLLL